MYINNRGKVEDTRLEAKDRPSQAYGPRRPDASALRKNKKKGLQKFISGDLYKNVFKIFFQAKKIFKIFFSGDLWFSAQKYVESKAKKNVFAAKLVSFQSK